MRALLYKDCYMILKYNRFLLLMVLVFAVSAGISDAGMFFAVYPPVIMSAMSFSSLAYDERSGWLQYADTLPYGRNKIVASKYLLSLVGCLMPLLVLLISMTVFGLGRGDLDIMQLGAVALIVLTAGTAYICVLLPASFRFGTEKGRLIYILLTVLFCCGAYSIPKPQMLPNFNLGLAAVLLLIGMIVIWGISYLISVKAYQNRKL